MRFVFYSLLFISCHAIAQPLRDLNYQYLYSGESPVMITLKPSRAGNQWITAFEFQLRDTTQNVDEYNLRWEVRSSLSDRDGQSVSGDSLVSIIERSRNGIVGTVAIPVSEPYKILVARVINNPQKRLWYFYTLLEPKYPEDAYLVQNNVPIVRRYVRVSEPISSAENTTSVVSFYDDNFPAASPPFSEGAGRVSKGMRVDSTFTLAGGQTLSPVKGLYLIQKDTNSTEGIAFRAEDDYPRLSKIESLADPLIYVCTKQEFERIKAAKGDKRAFDKVILSVTGDADRAKVFMKNYFRRVELANTFFTSYKEGWKTDRGMIYIIFGPPDEVLRFVDREVWNYKEEIKASFEFVKSASVFDPANYVLLRNKKYTQTWYEVIDLWRNARF